jgi:hypothetical protein
MIWVKWILSYLFDCVHPNTTWPHRAANRDAARPHAPARKDQGPHSIPEMSPHRW